ncbi:MAG TPA: antibiotic biosynthesis monooxygenase [Candidatus Limnocylindria bacterium]|nr:antibiotic biosynthesis monooxygenase [Candidatus Limnocylindria bacterium]
MRYTRLATYDIVKGTFDELTGLAEEGILPLFAREPGFVDYGLVDVGNHKVVSISIWETREQALKSATMAATWIQENGLDRVRLVITQMGGLALFRGAPVAA